MTQLYWKCPACGSQSHLWSMVEAMECLDCGIAPYKAIEEHKHE